MGEAQNGDSHKSATNLSFPRKLIPSCLLLVNLIITNKYNDVNIQHYSRKYHHQQHDTIINLQNHYNLHIQKTSTTNHLAPSAPSFPSTSHLSRTYLHTYNQTMPAEQSPIFPKLRFGQYAAVAASSLVTSNILKGAGSLNSALNSNIHFPIYTTNVDVPGYAVLGVTLAAAIVVCYWVEMAEAHEGKGIPSNMTPPTKEVSKGTQI